MSAALSTVQFLKKIIYLFISFIHFILFYLVVGFGKYLDNNLILNKGSVK